MAKTVEEQVEVLERVARNLIDRDLRLERVEDVHGMIYIAHGVNIEGNIVGLWGVPSAEHAGPSYHLEFKPDTSLEMVRQVLIWNAQWFLDHMHEQELLHA